MSIKIGTFDGSYSGITYFRESGKDWDIRLGKGSGADYRTRQLPTTKVVGLHLTRQVGRVVIEWKDRLARFGFTYLKKLCDNLPMENYGTS